MLPLQAGPYASGYGSNQESTISAQWPRPPFYRLDQNSDPLTYPPPGWDSLTSPQSLVRCHGARGGQRSPRPLGNLESPLGTAEWPLMGLYTLYRSHCYRYIWWSSVECRCFPFLIQGVPDKRQDLRVSTVGHTSDNHLNTRDPGQ